MQTKTAKPKKPLTFQGMTGKPVEIDFTVLKNGKNALRAIDNPLRKKIISLLAGKELTVTEIYTKLRIEQSVASQQLAIMRKALVVLNRRMGKEIYYRINMAQVIQIKSALYHLQSTAE